MPTGESPVYNYTPAEVSLFSHFVPLWYSRFPWNSYSEPMVRNQPTLWLCQAGPGSRELKRISRLQVCAPAALGLSRSSQLLVPITCCCPTDFPRHQSSSLQACLCQQCPSERVPGLYTSFLSSVAVAASLRHSCRLGDALSGKGTKSGLVSSL